MHVKQTIRITLHASHSDATNVRTCATKTDARAPFTVTSTDKHDHSQTHAMNLFGLVVNDSGLARRVTLVVLEHRQQARLDLPGSEGF